MNRYRGGKNGDGVFQAIINQIPPHDVYIECFLGSGAILRKKKPAPVCNFGIEIDPEVVRQWEADGAGNIVIQGDVMQLLPTWTTAYWASQRVFVYLDPPYLLSTRNDRYYRHEFCTPEEHARLLDLIKTLPHNWMVAISGYDNKQYDQTLKGWRRLDYQGQTRKGPKTESLWMNYPQPFELHDYRYLGSDYRQRERIKKKKNRWTRMLNEMPDLERYAILDAIDQKRSTMQTLSVTEASR